MAMHTYLHSPEFRSVTRINFVKGEIRIDFKMCCTLQFSGKSPALILIKQLKTPWSILLHNALLRPQSHTFTLQNISKTCDSPSICDTNSSIANWHKIEGEEKNRYFNEGDNNGSIATNINQRSTMQTGVRMNVRARRDKRLWCTREASNTR